MITKNGNRKRQENGMDDKRMENVKRTKWMIRE